MVRTVGLYEHKWSGFDYGRTGIECGCVYGSGEQCGLWSEYVDEWECGGEQWVIADGERQHADMCGGYAESGGAIIAGYGRVCVERAGRMAV